MFSKLKASMVLALALAANIAQAGVWAPAANPLIAADLQTLYQLPSNAEFGIFEDTADVSSAAPVLTFIGGAEITFAQIGSDFTVSSNGSTGTLIDSFKFQFGWNNNGVWETEGASAQLTTDGFWLLAFGTGQGNLVPLLAQVTPMGEVGEVPLPATAWFMVTSLFGMLFVGRRKA